MDLTHALHPGLQPLVDVSRHWHIGGCDLVQTPHSSQHGHLHLLASTPSAAASFSSFAAATKDQTTEPTDRPPSFQVILLARN
jgi:hypothetical protein